jgi:hypothetical protein
MLGITGNGLEGLGHRLKQQGIDYTRMLQGEGTARGGESKDEMTVGHVEELAFAGRQPGRLGAPLALWAVPIATGVIADLLVATVITLGFVPAESCGAALGDGLEGPPLRRRGHGAIAGQIVRPMLTDHIGDFKRWAGHG